MKEEKPTAVRHLEMVPSDHWERFFLKVDAARFAARDEIRDLEGANENPPTVDPMPILRLTTEWHRVIEALYDEGLIAPLDWMKFKELHDPQWRPSDAAEALMAIVAYVREDRFVTDALAERFESGAFYRAILLLEKTYRTGPM